MRTAQREWNLLTYIVFNLLRYFELPLTFLFAGRYSVVAYPSGSRLLGSLTKVSELGLLFSCYGAHLGEQVRSHASPVPDRLPT